MTTSSPRSAPAQTTFRAFADESSAHRAPDQQVACIAGLGSMNIVISHLDARRTRAERYRRKCLETLYHELIQMEVFGQAGKRVSERP